MDHWREKGLMDFGQIQIRYCLSDLIYPLDHLSDNNC